ncbi:MAG: heat-inducible transcriptional repressor HrcA [Polyangiales bacterium]|nr:heat-inducible transcription repressor HrcA [Myxococcales bacterium]
MSQLHPDLSFRARRILYSVITEYIATGEPVGSRKLSRRYGLQLSPASIRNVLADLEDAGYLVQPHTSAGRVPTDRGFRLFVDALVQMREVSADDRAAIASRLSALSPAHDDQIREAGRLLASMAGTAALLSPPRAEDEKLAQVRFVFVKPRRILAVLVTGRGSVQNRVVELDRDISPSELEQVHNYLSELVDGHSLAEVRANLADRVETERPEYVVLRRHALEMVKATISGAGAKGEVVIEGQGLLFDRPEFSDPEKIRAFVRTFEEKERLLGLLDQTLRAGGVQVLIGTEANLGDVADVSLISARYQAEGGATGSVGIIGPARVDYGKLVPLVEFTARMLSSEGADDDGDDD